MRAARAFRSRQQVATPGRCDSSGMISVASHSSSRPSRPVSSAKRTTSALLPMPRPLRASTEHNARRMPRYLRIMADVDGVG